MDERDTPMDEGLRALYRGLPADAPPPALDAAILQASREAVVVRRRRAWSVPLSLAAVLVLSVTVTLRVAEERLDLDPVPVATVPIAPRAAPSAEPPIAGPAAKQPESLPEVVALKAEPRREQSAAVPPPAPAFVPAPPAVATSAGAAAAERRRDAAPEQAPAAAPSLSAAAPAARSMADTAKRSAEAANVAVPLSPEAWLERIAELRAQSRHAEADESYAAFRKRYPEFVLTPALEHKIAPQR